jgi:uncharacterized protein
MKIPPKRFIFGLLISFMVSLAIWSFFIEPNQLIVKQHNLKLGNWSRELNGFKIVLISDIHSGSNFINEEKLNEIVESANAENADMILLLGDYLSPQILDRRKLKMPLETMARNIKGLRAKFGVFAVLGNHDNEFGHNIVRSEFEKIGYKVLENEAVSLEKNGQTIRLLGLSDVLQESDPREYRENAVNALNRIGNYDGKIVAFTHNPDMVEYLTGDYRISLDFSLFLAGHTHGGQCSFPIIGAPIVPSTFGQKYASGFVRENDVDIFVSTGIGTSIIPVRFGVPPEISVLTLEKE